MVSTHYTARNTPPYAPLAQCSVMPLFHGCREGPELPHTSKYPILGSQKGSILGSPGSPTSYSEIRGVVR